MDATPGLPAHALRGGQQPRKSALSAPALTAAVKHALGDASPRVPPLIPNDTHVLLRCRCLPKGPSADLR